MPRITGMAPRTHRLGEVSLERALSKLGLASRREAREWILAGRLSVGGSILLDPALPVVPERLSLSLDGKRLERPVWRTVLLHKPRGVVTTARDPQGRRSVLDLVDLSLGYLAPVGRLDWATSGLLLLTNDTRLSDWLCDPAHEVDRTYLVTVRGEVSDAAARRAEDGVDSDGERLTAASVVVRKRSRRESHLVVVLREGRNREVRRLFASLGHEVARLKRVALGGITLGDLPPGGSRELSQEELVAAFPGAPIRTSRVSI